MIDNISRRHTSRHLRLTANARGVERPAPGSRSPFSILGIEPFHPGVGRLARSVSLERDGDDFSVHEQAQPGDLVGHGTACAGIIRSIAPDVELVSVRVLGPNNRASGSAFARALEWVVEQHIDVVNLSLSSRSEELFAIFHELADDAYFRNCLLVSAASNTPGQASYPSLFSSVISVASHDISDPLTFFYNPRPPVEFGAWGVNVPVAWLGGSTLVASGNSFAAPHITGLAALVRSKYPMLTAFELKSVLSAVATPPREGLEHAQVSVRPSLPLPICDGVASLPICPPTG